MPLTANQKIMIPLLVEAAQEMDKCFQYEAYSGEPKFEVKDFDLDVADYVDFFVVNVVQSLMLTSIFIHTFKKGERRCMKDLISEARCMG